MGKLRISFTIMCLFLAGLINAGQDDCTYDFAAISKAKYEVDDPDVPNLIPDPLVFVKDKAYVWHADKKQDLPSANQRIDESMIGEVNREEGLFSMLSPESLIEISGSEEASACLHNFASMDMKSPPPGKYRFTCNYRGNHKTGSSSFGAYFGVTDGGSRVIFMHNFPDSGEDSDYWFSREKEFAIPEGVTNLHVFIRFDGVGYLKVSKVKFTPVAEVQEPEVLFRVPGSYDDKFGINEGDVESIKIDWRTGSGHKLDWWKTGIEFEIPKGFSFVGFNGQVEKVDKRDDGTTLVAGKCVQLQELIRVYPFRSFNPAFSISLLVRADAAAGTSGELIYQATYEGKRTGEIGKLELITIPPAVSTLPKRYLAGAMLTYNLQIYPNQPDANRAYAEHLRKCGVDWLMPELRWMRFDPLLLPMWREVGFKYITPHDNDYFSNGYAVPRTEKRPDADKFVKNPKRGDNRDFKQSSCPAAIYEERPFFLTNFVASIEKWAKGADGMWSNWEPFYFGGCYCDVCMARLEEWKKSGDSEEHFHSMQHGKICKTIQKHFRRIFGEGKPGFMPAICFAEVSSYARLTDYAPDKLSKDYIGDMEWVPAWGPYVAWQPETTGAWVSNRGKTVATFIAAKDMREEVDRNYPGKKPKIVFQPSGGNWMIQPEWQEIMMDAGFFNRMEACVPWVIPEGCDARLWAGFTRHVNRASKYENAVWDGERKDSVTTLTPKPGYAVTCPKPIANYLASFRQYFDYPVLQQTTYDYNGTRYIAVMNFNDAKHCEFILKTADIPVGNYTIICEDGTRPFGDRTFTSEELASPGVELSVPISATRVFEISVVTCLH